MKRFFYTLTIAISLFLVSCNSTSTTVKQNTKDKVDYSELKDLDIPKDNITLIIDGDNLDLKSPIYLKNNRYYICLNELVELLNGSLNSNSNLINVEISNFVFSVNLSTNELIKNNQSFPLRQNLITEDSFYYIGFSDLAYAMNMNTKWDSESKTIFCRTNDNTLNKLPKYQSKINQVGFLRLEDITLSTESFDKEYLEKIRIIGNYLNERNIPYHIAWIPRYISPNNKIDNDPMSLNNFENAEMTYTLDYFIHHNGSIGLHGYTHQRDNEVSAIGYEFGPKYPSTDEFKSRIEKAIETAKYLNIPIDFFEVPHYAITPEQNKIASEYFKILYYPFEDKRRASIDLRKPQLSPYNSISYFISTPLDYVHEENIQGSLARIQNANPNNMGSLFYHPRLDFNYINISNDNNIPSYSYESNSPLEQIINSLQQTEFKMSKVSDIK